MAFSSCSVNSFPSGLDTVPTQCVGMRADTLQKRQKTTTRKKGNWRLHTYGAALPEDSRYVRHTFEKKGLNYTRLRRLNGTWVASCAIHVGGESSSTIASVRPLVPQAFLLLSRGALSRSEWISFPHDSSLTAMTMGQTVLLTHG